MSSVTMGWVVSVESESRENNTHAVVSQTWETFQITPDAYFFNEKGQKDVLELINPLLRALQVWSEGAN